jgi:hypothetical protein
VLQVELAEGCIEGVHHTDGDEVAVTLRLGELQIGKCRAGRCGRLACVPVLCVVYGMKCVKVRDI